MNTTISKQNGDSSKRVPMRAPAASTAPIANGTTARPTKASNDTTLAKVGIAMAAFSITIGGWVIAANQMIPAATSINTMADASTVTAANTVNTASTSTSRQTQAQTLRQVSITQASSTQLRSVATTRSSR